jgi:hypothetical protein
MKKNSSIQGDSHYNEPPLPGRLSTPPSACWVMVHHPAGYRRHIKTGGASRWVFPWPPLSHSRVDQRDENGSIAY